MLILLLPGVALFASGVSEGLQAATPAPTATAAPSATPAVATKDPDAVARYSGAEQSQFIATANTAFVTQRNAKFQAFLDARTAFETAGGINSKGLVSKAAVIDRRDLLSKVRTANDDYLAFITGEEDTYRADLAKTPLVASDIKAIAADFATKANIPRETKLQQMEKDLLTCADDMLSDLVKWDGEWTVKEDGKLTFKKKANRTAYLTAEEKYNALANGMQQLIAEKAAPPASPSPSAAPTATP